MDVKYKYMFLLVDLKNLQAKLDSFLYVKIALHIKFICKFICRFILKKHSTFIKDNLNHL